MGSYRHHISGGSGASDVIAIASGLGAGLSGNSVLEPSSEQSVRQTDDHESCPVGRTDDRQCEAHDDAGNGCSRKTESQKQAQFSILMS